MKKIAVLSSGRGSNFQAIIDAIKNGELNCEIKVFITDKPKAQAIKRAKTEKIPTHVVETKNFEKRVDMDLKIMEILDSSDVDLVVLAGYMKIIKSKKLLKKYERKIINMHPSLLPAFKGSPHAQRDAFEYGCKVAGFTIHYVTAELDGGAIIYQKAIDISDCETTDEVSAKILEEEHKAFVYVLKRFTKGTFVVEGRRTKYIHFPI